MCISRAGFVFAIVHDVFKREVRADEDFAHFIVENHLAWDPVHGFWDTPINAKGLVVETRTKRRALLSLYLISCVTRLKPTHAALNPTFPSHPTTILGRADPRGPSSANDVLRGHSDGYRTFHWTQCHHLGCRNLLRDTRNNKIIVDTLSAYVRGSAFLPNLPHRRSVQARVLPAKARLFPRFGMTFRYASVQLLLQGLILCNSRSSTTALLAVKF